MATQPGRIQYMPGRTCGPVQRRKEDKCRSKTTTTNCSAAHRKRAQHGLPDRTSNFVCEKGQSKRKSTPNHPEAEAGTKKRAICVNDSIVSFNHPEVMGKQVKVKFFVKESGKDEWFDGVIATYNCIFGKYGVIFPCDGETVEMSIDDHDLKLMD